jgi:hypothetical protein
MNIALKCCSTWTSLILTWYWDGICNKLHTLTQLMMNNMKPRIKPPMPMVPIINHSLFDGTQTSLDPLKLEATYLGIALV